jgi:hypothetical protein
MSNLTNSTEFKRLQDVVTETCQSIAFHAYAETYDDFYNHLYEKIKLTPEQRDTTLERIIDSKVGTAFSAISLCFPDFSSLCDTVTRNCARSAIHEVIAMCIEQNVKPGPAHDIIDENLDLESVWEDLIAMNDEDEE